MKSDRNTDYMHRYEIAGRQLFLQSTAVHDMHDTISVNTRSFFAVHARIITTYGLLAWRVTFICVTLPGEGEEISKWAWFLKIIPHVAYQILVNVCLLLRDHCWMKATLML
jgi:hypothetical protein